MTDPTTMLTQLGDALEEGAAADLAAGQSPARRRRISPRLALLAAAVVVVVPSVALAATRLIGNDDVARSLPAGTLSLAGTNPTCTVVEQDVEYRCVLARAPQPEVSDWLGTVEPTVDATKHVNGGCRSLASDGRQWECYIGQAAVEQKIIGESFLGEYAPTPGVG
jgi:4-amino-4-deoxy-L-arabinose transferase-like glycosyltransferase